MICRFKGGVSPKKAAVQQKRKQSKRPKTKNQQQYVKG
jgi:hypothetical protein